MIFNSYICILPVNSFTEETAPVLVSSSSFGRLVFLSLSYSSWRGGEYLRRGLVMLVSPCSGGVTDTSLKEREQYLSKIQLLV